MFENNKLGIKSLLLDLEIITEKDLVLFSRDTRDKKNLSVWKDKNTNVIFINNFYVGKQEYVDGNYKYLKQKITGKPNFERDMDLNRRTKMFSSLALNKSIVDVGCGNGDFLLKTKNIAKKRYAVDIDQYGFSDLKKDGINCSTNLNALPENSIDIAFFFHSFEHFDNPLEMLKDVSRILKPKGKIIIEVPHAKDILLNQLCSEEFKNFTLWSQHLILHTRVSLEKLITYAGFQDVKVEGVQRYPLSNHLHWLHSKKPGGHKSQLEILDNSDLKIQYEKTLQKIDATDTLIACAEKIDI